MLKYKGCSSIVLRPGSTAEVSAVMRRCNERRLAVVPQGGNTGLVGGSVPVFDEVILSLSRLDGVRSFNEETGALVCGAGAVLETVDDYLKARGFAAPLDLGAKGSCQIGGCVSTNAGGLRRLRYGSMHARTLGLEVVLADGTVLDRLSTLKKDNTGYDVKHAFIGAEGSLGVVTAVAWDCPPRPACVELAFLAVESFEAARTMFAYARKGLGEALSACEMLDRTSLEVVTRYLPNAASPLPDSDAPFYVVIEAAAATDAACRGALESTIEKAFEDGVVVDGAVADSEAQREAMWLVREGISEGLRHRGAIYKYDLSYQLKDMYEVVEATKARLQEKLPHLCKGGKEAAGKIEAANDAAPSASASSATSSPDHDEPLPLIVAGYGHLGDGNIHLNISAPFYSPEIEAAIEPWVYEFTRDRRGSISAEHGLGRMKAIDIFYSQPKEAVRIMRQWKHALDPNGILNPYKVLPKE